MITNSVKIFSIFSAFGLFLIFNNFVVSQIPPDESTEESVTKVVVDNVDDQKWVEYEPMWKKMEEANAKQKTIIYNGEDGSCAILKNGEYENVDVDNVKFNCLDEFLDYAMKPACGNPKYEMMKTCAQQHVYEGKTFAESTLATGDVYEQMRAFALLDGCFKCNLKKNSTGDGGKIEVKVKVKITYFRPAGSFFTNCWEETATATPETIVDFDSDEHNEGPFTLPMNFFVRKCDNVFSYDAPPTKYEKIKMEVEHNCNGDGTKMETFTVDLPDFNPKEHAENFAEMRFVQFDLTKGANGISVWKKNKENGGAVNISIEDKLDWKINEKNADIPNPNNGNENGGGDGGSNIENEGGGNN